MTEKNIEKGREELTLRVLTQKVSNETMGMTPIVRLVIPRKKSYKDALMDIRDA